MEVTVELQKNTIKSQTIRPNVQEFINKLLIEQLTNRNFSN